MENQVAVVKKQEIAPAIKTPEEQIEEASRMANILQRVVKQAGLAKNFGGNKEHLEYEAWQTIAQFFSCSPVTEWTRPIKENDRVVGWEARVNVVDQTGRVVASAEGMCMRDEPNWKTKPMYAVRSMAQTRTAGKALRSVFAFVAVLAGYSATPAEEMSTDFYSNKPNTGNGPKGKPLSPKQKEAIFKAGKKKDLSDDEIRQLVRWKGDKEDIDPNTSGIADFFIGKDDDGNWKFDVTMNEYMDAMEAKYTQEGETLEARDG